MSLRRASIHLQINNILPHIYQLREPWTAPSIEIGDADGRHVPVALSVVGKTFTLRWP
jgi:hypothetical protein